MCWDRGIVLYPILRIKFGTQQVSYDWSKGAENHNPAQARNYILLHPTQVIIATWPKHMYFSFLPAYKLQPSLILHTL